VRPLTCLGHTAVALGFLRGCLDAFVALAEERAAV